MNRENFKNDKFEFFVGKYDYKWLCMPELLPWRSLDTKRPAPPFYGVHDKISLSVALIMGLQHCLAMVGGIIAFPIAVGTTSNNPAITQYLVSAALIVSGLTTFFHVLRFRLPFTKYYWGTGLISVCGTSSTLLGTFLQGIQAMTADGVPWDEAYGKLLGTCMICSFVMTAISFLPPKVLSKVFPPAICGLGLVLAGVQITANGIKAWGGGSSCADNFRGIPGAKIPTCLVPLAGPMAGAIEANGTFWKMGTCYNPATVSLCQTDGDVHLRYGSAPYAGLGLLVFMGLIVCEIFGSPFIRSCNVMIALLFGFGVSALITTNGQRYVNNNKLNAASAFTFLWTKTFPLGWYTPAVLPFCIGYVVLTVQGIGDIMATEEASRVEYLGPKHDSRIQGGMLGDGLNSVFSCLAFAGPMGIYAQNNGVIPFTRCANRYAGFACAFWLALFGVIGKVGAFFTSIPDCVLGGMTTFIFASISVSGLKLLAMDALGRRMRLILSLALGVGLGVAIVPAFATNNLWPVYAGMPSATRALRDSCILALSSPVTIGSLIAMLLNGLLPQDDDEEEGVAERMMFANPAKVTPMDDTVHGGGYPVGALTEKDMNEIKL